MNTNQLKKQKINKPAVYKVDESLYFVVVNQSINEHEYLKPEMLGTTKCLSDAGLFTKEEINHIYSLRKKSHNTAAIEALPMIKNRLENLNSQITELKFERDELDYLKRNIENGTIGSIVK